MKDRLLQSRAVWGICIFLALLGHVIYIVWGTWLLGILLVDPLILLALVKVGWDRGQGPIDPGAGILGPP